MKVFATSVASLLMGLAPPTLAQSEPNIVETAVAAGFNTLVEAVTFAGLGEALAAPEPRKTVFAPTDDAFAAYDEDERATIEGFDLQFSDLSAASQVQEEDDTKKWDGRGNFEVGLESDTTITPQQDALLNHYQSMHDDEKIDTDLLLDVLRYIHRTSQDDGAILVFLPGWQEISEFDLLLQSSPPFQNSSKFLVLPLHSGIPSSEQRRVLQRPPTGKRKIVLSTNIAETSL